MTTRARVVVRHFYDGGVEIRTPLVLEHNEPCAPGPIVGPLQASDGRVCLWLGKPGLGEPIAIGPGQSITITCEDTEP